MRLTGPILAAFACLAMTHGAGAQSYTPTPPVVKPNILPKPVANRLVKRPIAGQIKDGKNAAK